MKMYKTCKNDSCNQMNIKIKCSNTDKFCTKCGEPLIHICYTCLKPLDSNEDKYCASCINLQKEKKQERKEFINSKLENIPTIVTGVAASVPIITASVKKIITKNKKD